MKITAIIPIKHYSSRVPNKNYRLMNGKPLFHYILDTLTNCNKINEIIVDTNSQPVIDGIKSKYPNVKIYIRPKKLCGSDVSTNFLLFNLINDLKLESDLYIHTHTTNPLLKQKTIENAIVTFIENIDKYDSLFTVNKLQTRLYDKNSKPYNHNPDKLIPTQNLEPIYEENSCLYIVPHKTLMKYHRRIGNKPYMYVTNKIESQDIDWEEDFTLTEFIMQKFSK